MRRFSFVGLGSIVYGLLSLICLLTIVSGCVRLSGSAGYWKQGAEDAEPEVKQVGFDTNKLLPGDQKQGSITV